MLCDSAVQSANPSHRHEGGTVGILMPFWSLFHLLSVSFLTSDGPTFTLPDFAGSMWILPFLTIPFPTQAMGTELHRGLGSGGSHVFLPSFSFALVSPYFLSN